MKFKKYDEHELKCLIDVEKKVFEILEQGVTCINNRFVPLRQKLSPKVAVLQLHMDINPEKISKGYQSRYLENNGFINSHLCIDAETEVEHTEHDSSYTLIAVPCQSGHSSNKINLDCAKFEIFFNTTNIFVIDMQPGTVFTYSGYMMTHRQQLRKRAKKGDPFINIVTYNSKRLFGNMMESFRRDIAEDKNSLEKNS